METTWRGGDSNQGMVIQGRVPGREIAYFEDLARPEKSVCAWGDRLEKEVDDGCRQKIEHMCISTGWGQGTKPISHSKKHKFQEPQGLRCGTCSEI